MRIHNLMEDMVLKVVNEIFDDEENKKNMEFCTCHQCRLDVACYVLNKLPPMYMVSSRGLAHIESDYQQKVQLEADIVSLVKEGIEHVSNAKRPHFPHQDEEEEEIPSGAFFNFPQIVGRVYNSVNFEPVCNIDVSLLMDGQLVRMVNPNWENPYPIISNTKGIYSFWPYPMKADSRGLTKNVELEIAIDSPDYEPLRHFIKLQLESEDGFLRIPGKNRILNVDDIYLIPR